MNASDAMRDAWLRTRQRLEAKGLLTGEGASLSVRRPGAAAMWHGRAADAQPTLVEFAGVGTDESAALHVKVYAWRADVGAVAAGGGVFGSLLAAQGETMPQVFDEQARHLGATPSVSTNEDALHDALRSGTNVLIWRAAPLCLGMTCTRIALNAELFEKCAKAYVLASATGGRVKPLPWWVRRIANGRLAKDERRAAEAFSRGELPAESRAY